MKSFLLFVVFLGGIVFSGITQNRSIIFEPKDWKKAVAKAKKENKLIFLDCHTSWCGPCKHLAKNIFTQDVVADFYNEHFVNLNMDMEKDVDGVMLSKIYQPEAYPTLLFIDPQTELVVHRVTGSGDVQRILSVAEEALNSENTLIGSCNRYRKGDRSPEFLKKLMNDLKLAGNKKMLREVAETYFTGLNRQDLISPENWELFKAYIDNPYSDVFWWVISHRKEYENLFGEEEVAVALQWVIILELGDIANSMSNVNRFETEARYQKLITLLKLMDFSGATALLTDVYLAESLMKDCGNAWCVVRDAYQYNLQGDEFYNIPNVQLWYPLSFVIPAMEDQVILVELLGLIDRIKLRCSSMPYLARLALDRFLIFERMGKTELSRQAITEYEQYCTMR